MTKFLNKWFRKIHRWLAIPTALLIPLAIVFKLAGMELSSVFPAQFEQIQSLLILTLAITGAWLYLTPYVSKWQRNRRTRARARAQQKVQA